MVVGGNPDYDLVEVISLDGGSVPSCMSNLKAFPHSVGGAAGASISPGDSPMVCGGYTFGAEATPNLCYKYNFHRDTWEGRGRIQAASIDSFGHDYHKDWGLVIR